MVNLTFQDETQMKILEFLGTTEKMIADVTSKLSNTKKEEKNYRHPTLWNAYGT